MKITKIYLCEDCTVVFQVYGMNNKRKYFCPNCGDCIAVSPYKAERYSDQNTKIPWKPKELEMLQECIKGKLQPYQVAILIGRSTSAVVKKVNRIRNS